MELPDKVMTMLVRNQFLHLATCKDNVPAIALMNFSLVSPPQSYQAKEEHAVIVMATPNQTQKFKNITANPNVALIVSDWVNSSCTASASSVAEYLQRLNKSQLAQHSATLSGCARILEGDEAEYYRDLHLKGHPDAECFIRDSRMVLVSVKEAKVADSQNNVESF